MSVKYTNRIFVRMSKKELKEWLKDHPKAYYVESAVKCRRFCDICGKQINENKHWSKGFVRFTDYHNTEFHDLCSESCEKEFMRRSLERFENQPSDATDKITGFTVDRLDKVCEKKGADNENNN